MKKLMGQVLGVVFFTFLFQVLRERAPDGLDWGDRVQWRLGAVAGRWAGWMESSGVGVFLLGAFLVVLGLIALWAALKTLAWARRAVAAAPGPEELARKAGKIARAYDEGRGR